MGTTPVWFDTPPEWNDQNLQVPVKMIDVVMDRMKIEFSVPDDMLTSFHKLILEGSWFPQDTQSPTISVVFNSALEVTQQNGEAKSRLASNDVLELQSSPTVSDKTRCVAHHTSACDAAKIYLA